MPKNKKLPEETKFCYVFIALEYLSLFGLEYPKSLIFGVVFGFIAFALAIIGYKKG